MFAEEIVRAWKDEDFREQLDPARRAALPENPVGPLLTDLSDLAGEAGGPDLEEALSVLGWCPDGDPTFFGLEERS
jgi:mersacidin/lichenicidin family type 2 lantibiotic